MHLEHLTRRKTWTKIGQEWRFHIADGNSVRSRCLRVAQHLTTREQLALVARASSQVVIVVQNRKRLRDVRGAIVGGVAAIAAAGSFQRNSITIKQNILQSEPENIVPCLPLCIRKIDQW